MLRDDGAAMSASEQEADLERAASKLHDMHVRLRAASGPRDVARLMSAHSQKRPFGITPSVREMTTGKGH